MMRTPEKSDPVAQPDIAAEIYTTSEISNNKLRLVHAAKDRHDAVVGLIKNAKVSLKLFYYRFASDALGQEILRLLEEALDRDVSVELLMDGFGSNDAPGSFFDSLRRRGATIGIFSGRRSARYFIRNHQKMLIADDERAIIGGFNIDEHYFDDEHETGWSDIGLTIEGPLAAEIAEYYATLSQWCADSEINLKKLQKKIRGWSADNEKAAWLLGGPSNRLSPWSAHIKRDLQSGMRMDMVAAYFSPGPGLTRRIGRLGKRGHCRLIMASKSDNSTTIAASRFLYGYLLKRKVEIHEYLPRRLHAKMFVIDDAVYIGSANFDMRSLFINVEIMLRIEDAGFAAKARLLIDEMESRSEPITEHIHRERTNIITRCRRAISYFLVAVMDYTVSRSLNF